MQLANQAATIDILIFGIFFPFVRAIPNPLHEGQPSVPILDFDADHGEKGVLYLRGDRPALPAANLHLVYGANRRDFGGRAREEYLVGDVEELARNPALLNPHSPDRVSG